MSPCIPWKDGFPRMKTPPQDLDNSAIVSALQEGWSIRPADLRYLPLGFGSHHWLATTADDERWFVTLDDLRASHLGERGQEPISVLKTAFRTALRLRDQAALSFVIGPAPGINGEILHRLGERYALSVFPFLDVVPNDTGAFPTRADRDAALRLVGQVHNATGSVPVDGLRRNTLAIQDRDKLVDAMRFLHEPWTCGPYAEPARLLLRDHARAVQAAMDRFDELAASVMRDDSDWVITHGEPHASNVFRTHAGGLVMVDWDTVAFGPRERDLWMLLDDEQSDWTAYRDVTGVMSISGDAMRTYRLHWGLSEVAIFTGWCRDRHGPTEDMQIAWAALQQCVANLG